MLSENTDANRPGMLTYLRRQTGASAQLSRVRRRALHVANYSIGSSRRSTGGTSDMLRPDDTLLPIYFLGALLPYTPASARPTAIACLKLLTASRFQP
jgi:hypothetical protein